MESQAAPVPVESPEAPRAVVGMERDAKRPRLDEQSPEETPPGTPPAVEVDQEYPVGEYWSETAPPTTPIQGQQQQQQQQHRAEQREASIGRLPFGVQREVSELFSRLPRLRDELEPCCFDSLADFDEATGREIVAKFGSRDFSGVRSVTAYFCGLLKRYRAFNGDPRQRHRLMMPGVVDYPPPEVPQYEDRSQTNHRGLQHVAHTAQGLAEQASSIASLAPAVRDAIDDIFRLDGVRRVEMEPCCFESLRDFAEPVALRIVRDFRNADMRTLRDKTAFFCSILKRYRAQAAAHGKIFLGRNGLVGQSHQRVVGGATTDPLRQQHMIPHTPVDVGRHMNQVTPQASTFGTPTNHQQLLNQDSSLLPNPVSLPNGQQQPNVVSPGTRGSPLHDPTWTQRSPSRGYAVYEDPYAVQVWPYAYTHPGIVPPPGAYYGQNQPQAAAWGYMT